MELKSSFWILLLIGPLIGLVKGACHPKDFGHGSPVCVCSETQKCTEGDFAGLKLDKTVINGIRTTKSGDRFVKRDYHFVKEDPKTAQALKLELNPAVKHQKILGFGGAMTDAAGYNIAKLPADLQKRLIGDYFGDDGLEYRVVRVPIGGSDFSPRMYSLDDHENDDTLEKFALEKEDHEWKIPYLKMAQQLAGNKVKLFGSAWSSPKWMKTNNEFNHGGFLKGEPGTKYYQMFAHYLVKFLQAYAKENVTMWGMTVVNEPEFGADPNWGINVLGFSPAQQRDFVRLDLGPALTAAGFGPEKLKLMIHDDNVNKMNDMVSTVLSDAAAAKYVSGVAFHWYASGQSGQIGSLDSLSAKFPGVFFLGTEACELHSVALGEWQVAENYSRDIINDLNHNTAGWVEWNMVLDPTLKNHWADARMSASILVNSETKEYYKQPSYYALGHFSKLIPPESVRIEHKLSVEDQHTLATVFERPDGGRVTTVLNKNAHAVKLELHDPAHGFVSLELPANSIESFVWY